ncbi:AMP-binding protein [Saccharopolyspora indica]|uniref:phenylacetate--CoA ligase family protein n=1 Tax=Saccharopolyspora indica TaxID=1229659 RepID=UPI0022EAAD5D|nr:AMP-binding protein [Saccharopolyspora indica]MDA3647021.1 AMP-binding protein [Saccharopolyspora indica]
MVSLEPVLLDHTRYWNRRAETMSRSELAEWQWHKLKRALDHARRGSSFWAERIPADVESMADFTERVPLLHKKDLLAAQQEAPPFGSWPALAPELGSRYHQTSGTSGNPPVRTFDTAADWAWSVDIFCTALHANGVRPGHRGMVCFGYGLFMGFWGMHYALERMGCMSVPSGGLDSRARVQLLVDQQIEVIGCTPSYALRLLETAREMGIDLARDGNVQVILAGAEPRPDSTTDAIAAGFGARVFNAAGTTELGAVFMFECPSRRNACHVVESHIVEEVLHPDTLRPVGYGEVGVRVASSLGRSGMPLFRHWTEDLVIRRPWHACECGRTWDFYDGGILGRTDDMKKIRGISVTPVMFEDVIRRFSDEVSEYQTVLRKDRGLDTVVLRVEPTTAMRPDLGQRISGQVKSEIGIRPEVELAEPSSLPRSDWKTARFLDER